MPVFLLFGPTAVGKTDIIHTLSHSLKKETGAGIEVVSADSMQVYRGMDIGTAKPAKEERLKVPHWLIDIMEPDQQFDLGDFVEQAGKLVVEIRERGAVPVISGGTAYYFKHFIYGLPSTPQVTEDIRILVDQMSSYLGNERMHRMLSNVDPVSALRIHVNDTYRISRALEVYYATGEPLSSFSMPAVKRSDIATVLIGLNRPRKELYERINARVDRMFEAGLLQEVHTLYEKGFRGHHPGMRGIGYREFFEHRYFEAGPDPSPALEHIIADIKTNSRRYAKRQLTFFSSMKDVIWMDPDKPEDILSLVLSQL
ncbi:MAG: tRNA (adenosine(37)-N6)-dimethylallyltransferase MiaA [Spirochaetales bacterium]|nr:tRNA (adenosine(37)-N6)-dimethylallyltransferase MiaA [Spirochaetales bacterium]